MENLHNEYSMSILRSFYDEAWIRLANYPMDDGEINDNGRSTMSNIKKIDSIESMLKENWSSKFDEMLIRFDQKLMMMQRHRLCLGSLRYGKFGDKKKATKQDRVSYVKRKMKIAVVERNLEPLIDISNMLLLDTVESDHKDLRNSRQEIIDLQKNSQIDKDIYRLLAYFSNKDIFGNFEEDVKMYYNTSIHKVDDVSMYSFVDNRCAMKINLLIIDTLYKKFKESGNVAYLGVGIAVTHLYYRLCERLVKYELKAEDDGYHIPTK